MLQIINNDQSQPSLQQTPLGPITDQEGQTYYPSMQVQNQTHYPSMQVQNQTHYPSMQSADKLSQNA